MAKVYDPKASDKDRAKFVAADIATLAYRICNAVEEGSEIDLDAVGIGADCIELGVIFGFDLVADDLEEK